MKKWLLVLTILIAIFSNARAERIPGALYDKNGNLVSANFAPENPGLRFRNQKRISKKK